MSNATGRAALGQPVIDKRRSAYEGKISTSSDKTNQLDNAEAKYVFSISLRVPSCAGFFGPCEICFGVGYICTIYTVI
jgi:hypothetical protein